MTTPETLTSDALARGASEAAELEPLTFTRALKRNKFFSDEGGQTMIEMAIVCPFLMFALLTVMYYWGIADMQQDFYIRASQDYWRVVADGSTAGRTMTDSDQNMGLGTALAMLNIPGLSGLPILSSGGDIATINGLGLGVIAAADLGLSIQSTIATLGTLLGGTPYKTISLPVGNYDMTNPAPYQYQSPWRNSLMGMVSFFSASRGGAHDNDAEVTQQAFPQFLNMHANFRMIAGQTWHCERNPDGTEWRDYIGRRSSRLTVYGIPAWGQVVQGLMAASGGITMIIEGLVAAVGLFSFDAAYTVARTAAFLPPIINMSVAHNPFAFKVDTGRGSFGTTDPFDTYQSPRVLGYQDFTGLFGARTSNRCATANALGVDVEEMWK